mgnify:FL=1|tara:strand:+ start:231 stop:407 length:177 start_codon:yes stop_codon:yes gene_type:complete
MTTNSLEYFRSRNKTLEKENERLKEINKEHQKLNGQIQVELTKLKTTLNSIKEKLMLL